MLSAMLWLPKELKSEAVGDKMKKNEDLAIGWKAFEIDSERQ